MLEIVQAAGVDVASFHLFSPVEENSLLRRHYPAWFRTETGFCARVIQEEDWTLVKAQALKRAGNAPLMLQPCIDGEVYTVLGWKLERTFHFLDTVHTLCSEGPYRVALQYAVPSGLNDATFNRLVAHARRAGAALPEGRYFILMEYVLSGDVPVLTFIQKQLAAPPALGALLHHAWGIDKDSDREWVMQDAVSETASRCKTGAAVAWIPYRAGVVKEVSGADKARFMPGIMEVVLHVEPGVKLGHIIDLDTRDRGGYAVAVGTTANMAQERIRHAISQIRIITQVIF